MMNLAASSGLGGIDCPLPLPAPCPPNDYHHVAAGGIVLAGRFLEDQYLASKSSSLGKDPS